MNVKVYVIGALILGLAVGRYSLPSKIITETKVVEVEKKTDQSQTERDKHKKTVTHEKVNPDGSKETTTTTEESTETRKKRESTESSNTRSETKKETTYDKGQVNLSFLAGTSSKSGPIVYGAAVTKPILGPITIGAWFLTAPTLGVSIGVTF